MRLAQGKRNMDLTMCELYAYFKGSPWSLRLVWTWKRGCCGVSCNIPQGGHRHLSLVCVMPNCSVAPVPPSWCHCSSSDDHEGEAISPVLWYFRNSGAVRWLCSWNVGGNQSETCETPWWVWEPKEVCQNGLQGMSFIHKTHGASWTYSRSLL